MRYPWKFWLLCWVIWLGVSVYSISDTLFKRIIQFEFAQNCPSEHKISLKYLYEQPDDISCGPTSTLMILNHYDRNLNFEEVRERTKTVWFQYNGKDIGMTTPEDICQAFRSYGFEVMNRTSHWKDLKERISQNRPSIVLIRSGECLWHYCVVVGYNVDKVYIADPDGGRIHGMDIKLFLSCWGWETDSYGVKCSNYSSTFLQLMKVQPYTIICPEDTLCQMR